MRRIKSLLVVVVSTLAMGVAIGGTPAAPAKAKAPAAKAPQKPKGPPPLVTAEHKKALAEKFGGFKFGMTKDDILGTMQKQIDEQYEDKIKATTDIAVQDRLRKEKRTEVARVASSYIVFDSKTSPWDVSIVEAEFAHNTNESMMEHWENQGGQNQRRFFFFYDNKLWKMYLSLDVSIIPENKRNFDTFKGVMESQFGAGQVDSGTISWRAGDFDVRAVDRLKDYGALGLVVEDPKVRTDVLALRDQHKVAPHETSAVIKSIVDTDNKDHPDMKSNSGAVDAVIQAQGGTPPKK